MSVLIRGMEMPKDCLKCPFCLFVDGYWKCLVDGSHADFGGTCRPQNCPLVQVHTPHGRLIDADALKETIEALIEKHLHGYTKSTWDFVCELRSIISNAPTIIPAEEAEE